MSHKILSICIPTYNRADVLEKTLANIIAQQIGQVEIIISDNASSDHTLEVVSKFFNYGIKYFNNKENYGLTYNLIKSLELATSEFAVLLSDEDDINVENIITSVRDLTNSSVGVVLGAFNRAARTVFGTNRTKLKKKNFKTFLFNSFKVYYMSGIVFSRYKIDFDDLWREYNSSSSFGLLDTYPHIYIFNKLLLKYDLLIEKNVFCSFRDKGKNYISNLNGVAFFSPKGRYDQLEKQLLFVRKNTSFNVMEHILIVNRLLASFESYVTSFPEINKETLNYYAINSLDLIEPKVFIFEALNNLQEKKYIFYYDRILLKLSMFFRLFLSFFRGTLIRFIPIKNS